MGGNGEIAVDENRAARLQDQQAVARGDQIDNRTTVNPAGNAANGHRSDGADDLPALPLGKGQGRVTQGRNLRPDGDVTLRRGGNGAPVARSQEQEVPGRQRGGRNRGRVDDIETRFSGDREAAVGMLVDRTDPAAQLPGNMGFRNLAACRGIIPTDATLVCGNP